MSEEVDEVELIKRRKMAELQKRMAEEERRRELEARKQSILRVILTPEARSRIANLKIIKPEFAEQLEAQLISLAQQGKLPVPLTDEQLKSILIELQGRKRDIRITWM
ncbi:MAG: DNA-binding protein [Candidatus Methanomethyliaceae archaeon]|nr:DNA-binding protein [Candidatus Methanomethyliaceae archaeon]MDW7970681.1 DNA-binding protein [Nitrososphaerota archaeon]